MDLTTLTDEELTQLNIDLYAEQERRSHLITIPAALAELNANYLAAEGTEQGQEWRPPMGPSNAYPVDWEVTWNGKRWASTTRFNVWEPGVANWREVVSEGAPPPEWVQPTSAEDDYELGALVTFQGQVYKSLLASNSWSPTDYPQGWELQPPA